jgi:hypothetical protein
MCSNILEERFQPGPFVPLGILTKYNATHSLLLKLCDAEQVGIAFEGQLTRKAQVISAESAHERDRG